MRDSRRVFKSKLKWCQDNAEQIKMDILAMSCEAKKFGEFWQQTKGLNARVPLPAEVGGITGSENIANMFKAQFKVDPSKIVCSLDDGEDIVNSGISPLRFTFKEGNDAIRNMKRGVENTYIINRIFSQVNFYNSVLK
ncbi:unnamed protein product [Parnassius apollo]|uniref:(apollo) hypothetical protein n=1 Tax=Parnassius apollo TaxID=110799 RepID=A0A8S3XBY0_PARAO|nr:unnamed protein product [Parnassius apollo]